MLVVVEKTFDLGNVQFGKIASKEVEITNPTNLTVVVQPIGSSCSCTTGSMGKNPIPPNTTTKLHISFNSNKTGRGVQSKTINLKWKAGTNAFSEKIQFKVNVV